MPGNLLQKKTKLFTVADFSNTEAGEEAKATPAADTQAAYSDFDGTATSHTEAPARLGDIAVLPAGITARVPAVRPDEESTGESPRFATESVQEEPPSVFAGHSSGVDNADHSPDRAKPPDDEAASLPLTIRPISAAGAPAEAAAFSGEESHTTAAAAVNADAVISSELDTNTSGTLRFIASGTSWTASFSGVSRISIVNGPINIAPKEFTLEGGSGSRVTILGGGANRLRAGATSSNSRLVLKGNITASGLEINGTNANAANNLQIGQNASAHDVTMQKGAYAQVLAGGRMTNIAINGTASLKTAGQSYVSGVTISGTQSETASAMINGEGHDFKVHAGARLDVGMNGAVRDVTVNSGGILQAADGGSVSNVTLSAGAAASAVRDGKLTGVTVNNGAELYISGGSAASATVNGGGVMNVAARDGSYATVNSGGIQYITGGNGAHATLKAGAVQHARGGYASNATISSGAIQYVSAGALASGAVISGGVQHVSGGQAQLASIYTGGIQEVYTGNAGAATVYSGGTQNVSGGTADAATVNSGGIQNVGNGQAYNTTVHGTQNISGGQAAGAKISSGGIQNVIDGNADAATVNAGGTQNISGGQAYNVIIHGVQNVSGGEAAGAKISSGGVQNVIDGNADAATVDAGGIQNISGGHAHNAALLGVQNISGGEAGGVKIGNGGIQNISSGGLAGETAISSGGTQNVAGGNAEATQIGAGGIQNIRDGMAESSVINGTQNIYGGTDDQAAVFSGGIQNVYGGTANGTAIQAGGIQNVQGGTVNHVTVKSAGIQNTYAGTAVGTTVESGGLVSVRADGAAENMTIQYGGSAVIAAGVLAGAIRLAGYLELQSGADSSAAYVTLDMTGRRSADGVMVNRVDLLANGLTQIQNAAGLGRGSYLLAGGAASYTAALNCTGMEAGSAFTQIALAGRYSGAASGNNRSVLQKDSGGNLVLFVHERYVLLGNGNMEAIADDDSYTDMRSGEASGGYYAELRAGQNYDNLIFMGRSNADVTGTLELKITGAELNWDVAGGGYNGSTRDISVTVTGNATLNEFFYGGSIITKTAGRDTVIDGNINVAVESGFVNAEFIGGSRVLASSNRLHTVTGSINIHVSGGQFEAGKSAFMGGYVYGNNINDTLCLKVSGGVSVDWSGGVYTGTVTDGYALYLGALVSRRARAEVRGGTSISVTRGSIHTVNGGGWAEQNGVSHVYGGVSITVSGTGSVETVYGGGASALSGGNALVDGSVTITVTGGNVERIFGGGYAPATGSSVVTGDVNISVSGGTVGRISSGGSGNATVGGNATVTISGNAEIAGRVSGSGVNGTSTLILADYGGRDGSFRAEITGFDALAFTGTTSVSLTAPGLNLSGVRNWQFSLAGRTDNTGAMLDWQNGTNDFTGDYVDLLLASEQAGLDSWLLLGTASPSSVLAGIEDAIFRVKVDNGPWYELRWNETIATGAFAGWGVGIDTDENGSTMLKFSSLA